MRCKRIVHVVVDCFLLEIKMKQKRNDDNRFIAESMLKRDEDEREKNMCIDEFGNIFESLTTLSSIMIIKAIRRGKAENERKRKKNVEKEKNARISE